MRPIIMILYKMKNVSRYNQPIIAIKTGIKCVIVSDKMIIEDLPIL